MKKIFRISGVILLILIFFPIHSCKKDKPTPPVLTTTSVTEISQTTATSGGDVTDEGGAPVVSRGVCYSPSPDPTIGNPKTSESGGNGSFASKITQLTPNTMYYVRAYATNSAATGYGNQVSFTTSQVTTATLTTTAITSITQTTAISGGSITSANGGSVTAMGVCWSTTANPTIADNKTTDIIFPPNTDGSGTGSFTSNLTGLQSGNIYYVRSYATNSAGTAYGNEISFSTDPATVPVLTTTMVSSIEHTTATSGGDISSDGGATVTARGVCWGTSSNPTIINSKTTDGTGTGTFASSITGLTPGTTYYMRAYATNSAGTGYGNEMSFPTDPMSVPALTTTAISSIVQTAATSGGDITDDGGASVTARGVCWSTSPDPTITDSKTTDGTGTGVFVSSITGLALNTSYYVRAYATNSVGTAYGNAVYFSTNPALLPTLTTTAISSITITTATSGGNITGDGGSPVTARGVCFNITPNPSILNMASTDGTGTGIFTSNLTGLTAGTTYYLRAYATNTAGTGYGDEINFTTNPATVPVLTTTAVTSITQTTATAGGNITSDGGAYLTAKGFCWSTNHNPTLNDNYSHDGVGTGIFERNLTGLSGNTTYYIRVYATNSIGTAYGNEVTFTTSPIIPTITTTAISSITQTTAVSGGNISSNGGASVIASGVCWSTSANPTTANSKTTDGTSTGSFVSNLTPLTGNTQYHVRAYATNSAGTAYGDDLIFKTAPLIPTLTTTAISSITIKTASSGGNISSDGGASVDSRGVCWSTSTAPNIDVDNFTADGNGTGSFSSSLTGLSADTKYYVRAYATNSAGTAYGNEINFTTNPATVPVITTTAISSIAQATATSGGNITDDGGASVTAHGVCWNSSGTPNIDDDIFTDDGGGTGSFISNLTGLSSSTKYYVRAYATNSVGTAYGNQVDFTTSAPCISFTITHDAGVYGAPVGKTVIYGTVESSLSGEPKCWITRNLGATNQPGSATDATEEAAGWYFQFNRGQGYRHTGSLLTPLPWSITSIDEDYDWTADNDPCTIMLGTGWRIPTYSEWTNADGSWVSYTDTYSSVLKIHAAGYLDNTDGSLIDRGTSGHYWSATQSTNTSGVALGITNGSSGMNGNGKAFGLSVRCLRD